MDDVLKILGERLKILRKSKGLTQKEMADILDMTDRNYQRFEYGKINVSATTLYFLADFFQVTTDYLLGRGEAALPALSSPMEFIRLTDPTDPRFAPAFALYEISFPLHERRTRAAQEARLSHPEYRFTLLYEENRLQGILLYWEGPGFRYVEHFAIAPELRGGGVGARALAQLCAQGIPVLLEIDPPVDQISIRRQHFYERCGFVKNPFSHVHPPYRGQFQGHPLVVMSAPSALSQSDYDRFARYLFDPVMSDCRPPLEE